MKNRLAVIGHDYALERYIRYALNVYTLRWHRTAVGDIAALLWQNEQRCSNIIWHYMTALSFKKSGVYPVLKLHEYL